jgi:hypothetical protein
MPAARKFERSINMCETANFLIALKGLTIPSAKLLKATADSIVAEAKRQAFLPDYSSLESLSTNEEIMLLRAVRSWGYLHSENPPSANRVLEFLRQARVNTESNAKLQALKYALLAEVAFEIRSNAGTRAKEVRNA